MKRVIAITILILLTLALCGCGKAEAGTYMTIGQRIRMYREKKGKSRAAMERETGISAATIYHYEMDGMEPTASRIIWLADYFNITADELLRRNQ